MDRATYCEKLYELVQQSAEPFSPRLLTYDNQMAPVIGELRRLQTFWFLKELYTHCKEIPKETLTKQK